MLVVLDKELFEKEDKYSYEDAKSKVLKLMYKYNMVLTKEGWYIGGTYRNCMMILETMRGQNWFMHYIKEWKIQYVGEEDYLDLLVKYPKE